jgi:hypothetical protein
MRDDHTAPEADTVPDILLPDEPVPDPWADWLDYGGEGRR